MSNTVVIAPKLPADMMGDRVADQVPELTSVRPMFVGRKDKYPHSSYETTNMTSPAGLNCASAQRNGTIRFYVACRRANTGYAECIAVAEKLKAALIGWSATGSDYRIRKIKLADETDVVETTDDQNTEIFVKSIDFAVLSLKL